MVSQETSSTKNMLLKYHGYSPEQYFNGRSRKLPGNLLGKAQAGSLRTLSYACALSGPGSLALEAAGRQPGPLIRTPSGQQLKFGILTHGPLGLWARGPWDFGTQV